MTRLSYKGMAQNEVRLQLHALAYNLGVFLQGTDLPEEMADWSLTSLQTRVIIIGARVVRHTRIITFQLAELAVSGDLFNRISAASSGCAHRRFRMIALAMKSKGTWLNWSVWAGDVQPKSRVKPATEPKIEIMPHNRSPSTSTACQRVLIGMQNRYKLERTAFYLWNVG